jgi:hypothetical protein
MHRYFTFQECLQGEAAGFKLTSLEGKYIKSIRQMLSFFPVSKARTNKFYIWRQ